VVLVLPILEVILSHTMDTVMGWATKSEYPLEITVGLVIEKFLYSRKNDVWIHVVGCMIPADESMNGS